MVFSAGDHLGFSLKPKATQFLNTKDTKDTKATQRTKRQDVDKAISPKYGFS
jgi:hypothetical protein